MKKKTALVLAFLALALPLAFAHPTIEGGLKHGFTAVEGLYGSHIEIVADARAKELRLYISEAEDQKLADGKNHEWVINMTVRREKDADLLPMRDPGAGKEWVPVAPVETKGGYVYYKIEASARLMLDGSPDRRQTVKFAAGRDAKGVHCLKAALDLSKARTVRFEEVAVSVLDAKGEKAPWTKTCFNGTAWGLGKLHHKLAEQDFQLKLFDEFLAKVPENAKFRKPEAPPVPKGKK